MKVWNESRTVSHHPLSSSSPSSSSSGISGLSEIADDSLDLKRSRRASVFTQKRNTDEDLFIFIHDLFMVIIGITHGRNDFRWRCRLVLISLKLPSLVKKKKKKSFTKKEKKGIDWSTAPPAGLQQISAWVQTLLVTHLCLSARTLLQLLRPHFLVLLLVLQVLRHSLAWCLLLTFKLESETQIETFFLYKLTVLSESGLVFRAHVHTHARTHTCAHTHRELE